MTQRPPFQPPERIITCTQCHWAIVVADLNLDRDGGPYLDPKTYVCGACLEHNPKPAYGDFPKGY